MPTPKAGYYLKDGTRIPGVTTVLSKFKDPGALMHWAYTMGCEGKDYRKVREDAASIGTYAHAMVEAWIHDKPFDIPDLDPEMLAKAKMSFGTFQRWADQSNLKVTQTEVQLVSEKHRFGGTLDAMIVHGGRALGDWKTSDGIYWDYLLQLGAYGILWDENFPDDPIKEGYHLMRFSKHEADFSHHFWHDLDQAKEGFLLMRRLYEIKASLEKRVK